MKMVKLTQDDGQTIKDVWLNPIYLVTIEPAGSDPQAHSNGTMIRTGIGVGFCQQSMREVEQLLEEWDPTPEQVKPRRHRRSVA